MDWSSYSFALFCKSIAIFFYIVIMAPLSDLLAEFILPWAVTSPVMATLATVCQFCILGSN